MNKRYSANIIFFLQRFDCRRDSRFDLTWSSRRNRQYTLRKVAHRSFCSDILLLDQKEYNVFSDLMCCLQNAIIGFVSEIISLRVQDFSIQLLNNSHWKFLSHLMAWQNLVLLPPFPSSDWSFILLGKNDNVIISGCYAAVEIIQSLPPGLHSQGTTNYCVWVFSTSHKSVIKIIKQWCNCNVKHSLNAFDY